MYLSFLKANFVSSGDTQISLKQLLVVGSHFVLKILVERSTLTREHRLRLHATRVTNSAAVELRFVFEFK